MITKTFKDISKKSKKVRWPGYIELGGISFDELSEYQQSLKYNLKLKHSVKQYILEQRILKNKILPKGIHIKEIWDIPFSAKYKYKSLSLTYKDISLKI